MQTTQMRKTILLFMVAAGTLTLSACKDLTGSQALPSGVQNPSTFNTPAGALGMRAAAIEALQQALPTYVTNTGFLTDELTCIPSSLDCIPSGAGSLDERILPELGYGAAGTSADESYGDLQRIRALMTQAINALATYDTGAMKQGDPVVMRGELYALEGYTEILLADLFCSGVPLSTLDFQKDFTYHASSTTAQVYQDAAAKEDSAIALATTNDTIQNLARVLKGRALLALDSTVQAAQVVAVVPDGFQDQLAVRWQTDQQGTDFIYNHGSRLSDQEGQNGLPFVSGGDPRNRDTTTVNGDLFPEKYTDGLRSQFGQFTVADGIEARLIQAEAALQAHDTTTWLTLLNHLRKTATVPRQTVTPLDTLTDPGSDTARVSLTFQERAYWLYLTGHRQGDLRRLIRQYNRRQESVYPTGDHPGTGAYGSDVTAPIPGAEFANPLFHGCLSRGA